MPKNKKSSLRKFGLILLGIVLSIIVVKSVIGYISAVTGSVTEEEAAEFLRGYGWETAKGSVSAEEVYIPSSFGEVYERYNAIQLKQGFDLTRYKGERVMKYTFSVTNYKGYDNVEAHVLTYGGKIIGGDICSTELNGFMTGFEKNQ